MIWNIDYASFRSKSIIAQNNLSKLALMIKEKNWYKNKDSYENIQLVLLNYKYVKGFHELAKEYEKQNNENWKLQTIHFLIKREMIIQKKWLKVYVKNFETQQLRNEQTLILTGIAHFYCKTQYKKL